MGPAEREYHASRVTSGVTRCVIGGTAYRAAQASREHRYLANEVYLDSLREAELQGLLRACEVPAVLAARGLWSPERDADVEGLVRAVEDGKVGLFENYERADARGAVRHAIDAARSRLAALEADRDALGHVTAEGVAAAGRARFLTGCSLLLPDGSPHWPDPPSDWCRPDSVVDEAVEILARSRLGEGQVREIARTEPWASVWSARGVAGLGLFGAAAADLTDEQRYLVRWSLNYDLIREHPECPSDAVVEDDDALDGWMTVQRRKRENALLRDDAGRACSDRVMANDEVYLMADRFGGAGRVEQLNDANARNAKARRIRQLRQHGELSEMGFEDTQQRFRMEVARRESQSRK